MKRFLLIAAATWVLAGSAAHANPVTVGALDPKLGAWDPMAFPWSWDGMSNVGCGGYDAVFFLPGVINEPQPNHPLWTVPAGGGVLTWWRTSGQRSGGRFRLIVFRYRTDWKITIRARSDWVSIATAGVVNTPTHIPVEAGDVIALNMADGAGGYNECYYPGPSTDPSYNNHDFIYTSPPAQADSDPADYQGDEWGYRYRRVNVEATLDQPGTDAPNGTPAAPPSGQPANARACVVPKLKRSTLKRARRLLRRRHCRLGRVISLHRGQRHRPRRVVRQRPVAGVTRRRGAHVSVAVR